MKPYTIFGLLKLAKQGKYVFKDCKLPHYLPKDGYTTLIIGFVRLNKNKLILPFSNVFKKTHKPVEITIPPILLDKKVKEIRILPKANVRFFEIQYIYEAECIQRNSSIGKQNNQTFVNIPYGKLREKLEYLCELNGIEFVKQEESYTSKG